VEIVHPGKSVFGSPNAYLLPHPISAKASCCQPCGNRRKGVGLSYISRRLSVPPAKTGNGRPREYSAQSRTAGSRKRAFFRIRAGAAAYSYHEWLSEICIFCCSPRPELLDLSIHKTKRRLASRLLCPATGASLGALSRILASKSGRGFAGAS